ncbi:uncharacterized protein LOC107884302 [Acyrthosiphon pisum]|uniref:Uncharacterized protein n=1 Tax=Acyrthosiphon pisum TaxID=7029 RepID=A0A8R2NRL0_ACYPI|nr:uncharacterized protein LOC107884302 [Acyrthosiphon pisum]
MSQYRSLINNTGDILQSPPLVRASNTAQIIGNTVSYSNIEPPTLPQIQQLNTWNVEPISIIPATEIIDLTSPPPIPVPPTVQENYLPFERELTVLARDTSSHAYIDSTMSQYRSLINNTGDILQSPPLVRASNTAQIIGNTVSYSNIEPPTLPQIQQLNTWNVEPISIIPATEIIDLTSPPPIPVPPTVQENYLPFERELTVLARDTSSHAYIGSTMSQYRSLINNTGDILQSPPLVRASNTAQIIGNTVSYSNIEPPTLPQIQQLNTWNVEPISIVPATEIIDLTSPGLG